MTREQCVGLEPLPNGTVVEMVDPYKKTYYFEQHFDTGVKRCAVPKGYTPRPGWKHVKARRA